MRHEESRPWQAGPQREAIAEHPTTPDPAPTFHWERCPRHPWYGVSVAFTDDAPALCIPPLDGTPNHWHEVAA